MPELSITLEQKRELAIWYLKVLLTQGIPYYWGGDDPLQGFDCNGLIHEVLQAVGLEEHGYDCKAHQLYLNWKHKRIEREDAKAGCLVFWFKSSGQVGHVEMMIDGNHSIGASGGGEAVKDLAAAIKYNAFIKLRPIDTRGPNFKIVDPFKETE